MTPLPKTTPQSYVRKPGSTAGTSRVRRDNPIPMTAMQHARWTARQRPTVAIGTRLTAKPGTPPTDEMDAGFYAALQASPRLVGTGQGEIPLPVALRLVAAGLAGVA